MVGRPLPGRLAVDPFHAVLGRKPTAEGRRELRILRREPLLDLRAPGAGLRTVDEAPAGKDLWNAEQPTEIRQAFSLAAEPGETVERYRRAAEAAGWRWVETLCQFEIRSTRVLVALDVEGVVPP